MLKKQNFALAAIALIFLGVYFWLVTPISTGQNISHRFDWPDEVSNYFWVKNYAQTDQLYFSEPLNTVAENQIHPRSFNVRSDGSVVPGSFFGLIIFYGLLAKVIGSAMIIYVTPILAILASFCFYGIIRRIFDQKIAFLSLVLMLFHPVWLYYSVTSMLPNVCFVSLIIISVWLLIFRKYQTSYFQIIFSALAFGIAASIRPVEIFWIIILYFLLFIHLFRRLNWKKSVIFIGILFLAIAPSIYQQRALFGDILVSGYDKLYIEQSNFDQISVYLKSFIAPFGIHPKIATDNLWLYFFRELWWLSIFAVLGLFIVLLKLRKNSGLIFGYILFSLFLFFWLGNFYGSWKFTDELTMKLNVLGLSYFRYWLPIYIISIPFIAASLAWISSLFRTKAVRNSALVIFLTFIFFNSAILALYKNEDSIIPVRQRIAEYKKIAAEVFYLTEPDSVIITVRKDKVFFPERKVIHTFERLAENKQLIGFLPELNSIVPVYYYSLGFEKNLPIDNGINLELVKNIGQDVLYKIK